MLSVAAVAVVACYTHPSVVVQESHRSHHGQTDNDGPKGPFAARSWPGHQILPAVQRSLNAKWLKGSPQIVSILEHLQSSSLILFHPLYGIVWVQLWWVNEAVAVDSMLTHVDFFHFLFQDINCCIFYISYSFLALLMFSNFYFFAIFFEYHSFLRVMMKNDDSYFFLIFCFFHLLFISVWAFLEPFFLLLMLFPF